MPLPPFSCRFTRWVVLVILVSLAGASIAQGSRHDLAKKMRLREEVRKMFYHAYDNYLVHAFPHDELKPLTKSFTDSLSELGNLKLEHLPENYSGSALTLIESLSSLVVLGNYTEFERAILWLGKNIDFDVDARISLFECNIRVLGGLVSAHILATDYMDKLVQRKYNNQLLHLAVDLGERLLPAFNTPTGLPYAWINLKHGVMENETTETSTSGCGSLILEMGTLSRLTGDSRYEAAALRALRKLWSMRSSLNLVGTTLDVLTGEWIEYSTGIGAGVDSFYEYLLKAHILFGREELWDMFHSAYVAAQKYFRHGSWYHEADMRTGKATYWQLTSLQAFWPGVQVLIGDVAAANSTHREFFHVWKKFGVLPERCKYLYLIFDDTFLTDRNYIFTTEGHPLPVRSAWQEWLPEIYLPVGLAPAKCTNQGACLSAMSQKLCPSNLVSPRVSEVPVESVCHVLDSRPDHRCESSKDCGIDSITCRKRTCSSAGYCGLWLL